MEPQTEKEQNSPPANSRIKYSSVLRNGHNHTLQERLTGFAGAMQAQQTGEHHLYFRTIGSATDRVVTVIDKNRIKREMLMFGSNNYLGLANHPYILKKVKKTIDRFGVGIAGPPLLNGYSALMAELEERLSALKGTESTLVFTSGYNANLGLVNGICTKNDLIIADEYNHASFFDGIKLIKGHCLTFHHNDIGELGNLLKTKETSGDIYIAVEGVYSMDGDVAPLDKIIPLAQKYNARLLIDDAHGTGVLGQKGEGTLEEFGFKWSNEVILGTFSKALAVNGGFISGSKELISYLRFMSRPYMFSASLPPVTIAAVIAGLDVIEKEPWRRIRLRDNVAYLSQHLTPFGLTLKPDAGIVSLAVPPGNDIRKMANQFNNEGIFLNAIEFPAVPSHKQRFRISVMANHTKEDLDRLVATIDKIWRKNSIEIHA